MRSVGADAALEASRRAEALAERAIQLTQELVRANTVNRHSGDAHPGNEANGQRVLRPLLKELGGRIEEFDCPADVYTRMGVLGPRDRDFSDRPNLLSLFEYGSGGPTIVLQGHMDTVGVDDMSLGDPFSAKIEDGRLWGRGATDMKGGLAAIVTALSVLRDQRSKLRGRIVFASVVEEESNGSGAGALA
ncbi:MAG TPA: M20/M25/M40 family metallo-hydrolase, partial [Chloroflexota bacterium]|nr:M20/M25/M40 family metallo-hydrolase [Chloroflexota bacterium]